MHRLSELVYQNNTKGVSSKKCWDTGPLLCKHMSAGREYEEKKLSHTAISCKLFKDESQGQSQML